MPRWAYLKKSVELLSESATFFFLFLDDLIEPLPAPGRPVVVSHREVWSSMSKQIGYTLKNPDIPTPNDVVKVRLYAIVDGAASPFVELEPGAEHEVVADVGKSVEVYYTAVDDAGNESEAGDQWNITVVDDIAPGKVQAPMLVSHREIATAAPDTGPTPTPVDPVVTPMPDPTPVPIDPTSIPTPTDPTTNPVPVPGPTDGPPPDSTPPTDGPPPLA